MGVSPPNIYESGPGRADWDTNNGGNGQLSDAEFFHSIKSAIRHGAFTPYTQSRQKRMLAAVVGELRSNETRNKKSLSQ